MYFNHAFRKDFISSVTGGTQNFRTTGSTFDLTAGEIGLFDAKSYAAIATAAANSGNRPFILAQGSFRGNDKIGQFHGGYSESIKSKMINPRYVTRFFKTTAVTAQTQVIEVAGLDIVCGETYQLRLDVSGSPVLRTLKRNGYHTLDAFSGCCADNCAAPCNGDPVDENVVLLQWADQINEDPIMSKFVKATVYNGATGTTVITTAGYTPVVGEGAAAVVGRLRLEVAYEDTKFGNATFSTTDHYELEPISIQVSAVDESGEPCAVRNRINSSTGEGVTEIRAARQASGSGETVLRRLILHNRYLQDPFPDATGVDSLRKREVQADPTMTQVDRNGLYDQICILHSVPRFNNPSSTFDNDQYLLVVNVPTGTNVTAFTTLVTNLLIAGGNPVTLEQF